MTISDGLWPIDSSQDSVGETHTYKKIVNISVIGGQIVATDRSGILNPEDLSSTNWYCHFIFEKFPQKQQKHCQETGQKGQKQTYEWGINSNHYFSLSSAQSSLWNMGTNITW